MGAQEREKRLVARDTRKNEPLVLRLGDAVLVDTGGDLEEGTLAREQVRDDVTGGWKWVWVVAVGD